jgi:hypothetical protein
MSGGGWIKLHRGWRDCDAFGAEPYCERMAWVWLMENAAWKPMTRRAGKGDLVVIGRGQLHVSDRALGAAWGWERKRVERFLTRLERRQMVTQQRGHSGNVITIVNYEVFQKSDKEDGPSSGPSMGPIMGQPWATQEERKEGKEEKEAADAGSGYAFEGTIIRLNQSDLSRWRSTFDAIPDLGAELTSLDAWLCGNGRAKQANWFQTVAGSLNKKHQELLAARAKVAADPDYMPL